MRRSTRIAPFALDLHVLGTPPAFVLSQDQTLQLKIEVLELASLVPPSPFPWEALSGVHRVRRGANEFAVRDASSLLREALPDGRARGRRRAHPIELTAVSAIVLDLLSGFQRPSDPVAGTLPSRGGPTLVGVGDISVKPLTGW